MPEMTQSDAIKNLRHAHEVFFKVVDSHLAALEAQPDPKPEIGEETAWVIEKLHGGEPSYFTGSYADSLHWSCRHSDALRFARRADAERMLHEPWLSPLDRIGAKVSEHAWVGPSPKPEVDPAAVRVVAKWFCEHPKEIMRAEWGEHISRSLNLPELRRLAERLLNTKRCSYVAPVQQDCHDILRCLDGEDVTP